MYIPMYIHMYKVSKANGARSPIVDLRGFALPDTFQKPSGKSPQKNRNREWHHPPQQRRRRQQQQHFITFDTKRIPK